MLGTEGPEPSTPAEHTLSLLGLSEGPFKHVKTLSRIAVLLEIPSCSDGLSFSCGYHYLANQCQSMKLKNIQLGILHNRLSMLRAVLDDFQGKMVCSAGAKGPNAVCPSVGILDMLEKKGTEYKALLSHLQVARNRYCYK